MKKTQNFVIINENFILFIMIKKLSQESCGTPLILAPIYKIKTRISSDYQVLPTMI